MRKIGSVVIVALLLIFSYFIYHFIHYRTINAVSDAAFVKSDSLLTLGFKVGGKVIKLTKKEGDVVKEGELLALIDDKDFQVAKRELIHTIASLDQKIVSLQIKYKSMQDEIAKQKALTNNAIQKLHLSIKADHFKILADEERLSQLKRDLKRLENLYKKHLIQKEKVEKLKSSVTSLSDLIQASKLKHKALETELQSLKLKLELLNIKERSLAALDKEIESLVKKRASLEAKKEDIQNKIDYTKLYAPIDGVVAKRYIALDRVVKKGSAIFSIVDPKDLHIEVLLSEKKLQGVRVGNRVKITIDAFKDREYRGVVSKILPASAATFSLVPRDIASGEFTKLDQRFIIRIAIKNPTPDLRVGMGASVAIERSQ